MIIIFNHFLDFFSIFSYFTITSSNNTTANFFYLLVFVQVVFVHPTVDGAAGRTSSTHQGRPNLASGAGVDVAADQVVVPEDIVLESEVLNPGFAAEQGHGVTALRVAVPRGPSTAPGAHSGCGFYL